MSDKLEANNRCKDGSSRARAFYPGCGPTCPYRDISNGRCERHGPSAADQIVERVASGFKRDLAAIIRSDK